MAAGDADGVAGVTGRPSAEIGLLPATLEIGNILRCLDHLKRLCLSSNSPFYLH